MQFIIPIRVLYSISCIFYAVTCTILRLPCMTDANFNVIENGKRLKGNVISKHYGATNVQCTIFCVQNLKCRSYNINQVKLVCELNSKALADNGTVLVDDNEWQYKSTNYSNLLVGPLCRTQKPCKNGVLCRDSCSPPFYECVYCDANNAGLHCKAKTEVNECKGNPCENGGECVNQKRGRKCNCKKGYTGKNCEIDIDECYSLPCFNGGTCENNIGSFNCTCAEGYIGVHCQKAAESCLDLYRYGKQQNGIYEIFNQSIQWYKVFCDFESDNGSVWTLITSFSLSNNNHFKVPLFTDSPRNESNPNWMDFRLSLQHMESIRSSSTIWRATCSFPTYKSNITRDSMRAQLSEVDILKYKGDGDCKKMTYINIRGHNGTNITAACFQKQDQHFHTDSYFDFRCTFDARQGSVEDEDNFGLYIARNPAFRCTESAGSTTQYWFGAAKEH